MPRLPRAACVLACSGALSLAAALSAAGCGSGSSGGGLVASVAAPVASSAPTPLSSSSAAAPSSTATPGLVAAPPAPPPPLGQLLLDPSYVPSAPSAATWYERVDDPATPDNEAARELARELAGNGVSEAQVYEHLTQGGPLAVFVSGAGHERDTPQKRSGWMAPYARYVQATLGIPGVQVDYEDWAAGNDAKALATYPISFRTGVVRTLKLVEKARSAGAHEVFLYGHSKGGDVVQEVCWLTANDPFVLGGVALGVPLWSAARQDQDGRYGYGGLFRLGLHRSRDYRGKLVLFVRYSDRVSRGELLPASSFPGPGHDYEDVLATPGFPELLDRARFVEPPGFADRAAGRLYDY
ncbi:MAG: hypothetical protein AB7N76_22650 [Planctomycetota bacterium]